MLLLPRGEDEDWESLPEEPALAEEAETLAQPVASDSETKPIGGAV